MSEDLNSFAANNSNDRFNAVQSLVNCCLNIQNVNKRQKAIADIVAKSDSVRQILDSNPELIRLDVEQALIRAATGYTVTERKERIVNGRRSVEITTKQIPPNQSAMEFYLINRAGDSYSKNPTSTTEGGNGKVDEILEALKNVR
uniref:Terminase small subunit n=1 Tax=Phage sp. ctIHi3 TaxID=2825791 RepID=A0A8S5Q5Y2_9VIRU|nr:MAG TPA: terminase small subunit [Phage sp. ctIHi3]DAG07191.1 MAG TPA: terminase small subunit [Caudoviricetes sp.]